MGDTRVDKPIKDKFYDDICDSWRYGAENFMKYGIGEAPVNQQLISPSSDSTPWSWMERVQRT